jgi:hypothetical protein
MVAAHGGRCAGALHRLDHRLDHQRRELTSLL